MKFTRQEPYIFNWFSPMYNHFQNLPEFTCITSHRNSIRLVTYKYGMPLNCRDARCHPDRTGGCELCGVELETTDEVVKGWYFDWMRMKVNRI